MTLSDAKAALKESVKELAVKRDAANIARLQGNQRELQQALDEVSAADKKVTENLADVLAFAANDNPKELEPRVRRVDPIEPRVIRDEPPVDEPPPRRVQPDRRAKQTRDDQLEKITDKNNDLRKTVTDLRIELKKVQNNLEKEKTLTVLLEKAVAEATGERDIAKQQAEALRQAELRLEGRVPADLANRLEEQQRTLDSLEKKLEEKQRQLLESETRINALNDELVLIKRQNEDLSNENDILRRAAPTIAPPPKPSTPVPRPSPVSTYGADTAVEIGYMKGAFDTNQSDPIDRYFASKVPRLLKNIDVPYAKQNIGDIHNNIDTAIRELIENATKLRRNNDVDSDIIRTFTAHSAFLFTKLVTGREFFGTKETFAANDQKFKKSTIFVEDANYPKLWETSRKIDQIPSEGSNQLLVADLLPITQNHADNFTKLFDALNGDPNANAPDDILSVWYEKNYAGSKLTTIPISKKRGLNTFNPSSRLELSRAASHQLSKIYIANNDGNEIVRSIQLLFYTKFTMTKNSDLRREPGIVTKNNETIIARVLGKRVARKSDGRFYKSAAAAPSASSSVDSELIVEVEEEGIENIDLTNASRATIREALVAVAAYGHSDSIESFVQHKSLTEGDWRRAYDEAVAEGNFLTAKTIAETGSLSSSSSSSNESVAVANKTVESGISVSSRFTNLSTWLEQQAGIKKKGAIRGRGGIAVKADTAGTRAFSEALMSDIEKLEYNEQKTAFVPLSSPSGDVDVSSIAKALVVNKRIDIKSLFKNRATFKATSVITGASLVVRASTRSRTTRVLRRNVEEVLNGVIEINGVAVDVSGTRTVKDGVIVFIEQWPSKLTSGEKISIEKEQKTIKSKSPVQVVGLRLEIERLLRQGKDLGPLLEREIGRTLYDGEDDVISGIDAFLRTRGTSLRKEIGDEKLQVMVEASKEYAQDLQSVKKPERALHAYRYSTDLQDLLSKSASSITTTPVKLDIMESAAKKTFEEIVGSWDSPKRGASVRNFAQELASSDIVKEARGAKLNVYIVESTNDRVDNLARKFGGQNFGVILSHDNQKQFYPKNNSTYEPAVIIGKRVAFGLNKVLYDIVSSGMAPGNRDIKVIIVRQTTGPRSAEELTTTKTTKTPLPASRGSLSDIIDVTVGSIGVDADDDDCYVAIGKAIRWIEKDTEHISKTVTRIQWNAAMSRIETALNETGYNTTSSEGYQRFMELQDRFDSY